MKLNRGFSLTEVIVALAILSVVAATSVSLIKLLSDQYFVVRERIHAEIEAARAENLLRNYFGQAINIDFATGVVPAVLASTTGVIANNINYDQIADIAGNWAPLAAFWRETETLQGAGTGSQPRETAMWFFKPSLATKGVLFINGGSDPGTNAAMSPGYNNAFVEGITLLRITKKQAGTYDKTASIDVTLRIRYHPSHSNDYNWCPEADIVANASGCGAIPVAIHNDIERSFRIVLRNNLVHPTGAFSQNSAVANEERSFGNLFFFSMVKPVQ